ncbi:MAG: sugar transferase, partial [Acidimicrobiales bacterium]
MDAGSDAPSTKGPRRLRARLMTLEGVAFTAAWAIALLTAIVSHRFWGGFPRALVAAVALGLVGVGLSWAFRLYQSRVAAVRSITVERQALIAIALSALAFAMQRWLSPLAGLTTERPPLLLPALGGILSFVFVVLVRSLFEAWLTFHRANGALSRPVVLVGRSHEVIHLNHLLENHPEIGYHPVGYLSDELEPVQVGVRHLGGLGFTVQALDDTGATGVLIAANGVPSAELNSLVRTLHAMGVHVHLSSGLTRIGHRRVRQLPMAHEPFFYLEPASPRRLALAFKRVGDVLGASLVLLLTSPILLVAALAVKLSDGGPVFFNQVRIGQDGRRITIRKIRSMTVDAEEQLD